MRDVEYATDIYRRFIDAAKLSKLYYKYPGLKA